MALVSPETSAIGAAGIETGIRLQESVHSSAASGMTNIFFSMVGYQSKFTDVSLLPQVENILKIMCCKFFCFCSALAASSSVLANSACDAADGKWSSCGTGFSRSGREVNVVIDSSSLVSRRLRSVLQEYTSRINSINRILAKTPAVIRQKIGDFKFTNLFLNSVFIQRTSGEYLFGN